MQPRFGTSTTRTYALVEEISFRALRRHAAERAMRTDRLRSMPLLQRITPGQRQRRLAETLTVKDLVKPILKSRVSATRPSWDADPNFPLQPIAIAIAIALVAEGSREEASWCRTTMQT